MTVSYPVIPLAGRAPHSPRPEGPAGRISSRARQGNFSCVPTRAFDAGAAPRPGRSCEVQPRLFSLSCLSSGPP